MALFAALVGTAAGDVQAGERPPYVEVASQQSVPLRTRAPLTIVQQEISAHGLVVRGGFETLEVAQDGGVRSVAGRYPAHAPEVPPQAARIGVDELPLLVARGLGLRDSPPFERAPVLVYRLILGEAVLAWEVQLPLSIRPEPSRLTVWISAMSGRLLETHDEVQSARARVFPENPSATPQPIEVELEGLIDPLPGAPLVGARVVSWNCVDTEPEEVPPWYSDGECYPAHVALADPNGDFLVPLPDVIDVADNVAVSDAYAELSMYYHAERFLEVMQAKGLESFACPVATMLANFHGLGDGLPGNHEPLNNAYYTNQCDPERGVTMLFGQGSDVDFAFDGDVVYHELGHGVVATLTPDGLGARRFRSDGSVVDSGAINEAIADYFAFALTDDPFVADYVGRFWTSSDEPYIRSGLNQNRCPDSQIGQVHNDGEVVMAALWTIRDQVGARFDRVVLEGLTRLPADALIEEAAAIWVDVVGEYRARGDLTDADVEVTQRALGTRGMLDCPRVLSDPKAVEAGRTAYLRAVTPGVQPFVPGPFQLRFRVPPGATEAVVSARVLSRDDGVEPEAVFLVKRAADPIEFGYALVGVDDPGDPTGTVGRVREVVQVSGDWDDELVGVRDGGDATRATISGLRGGEVVHVSLASVVSADLVALDFFVTSPGFPAAEETAGESGAEADPGTERVRPDAGIAGGCGCAAPVQGHGGPLGWVVCGGILWGWRWRRSRA